MRAGFAFLRVIAGGALVASCAQVLGIEDVPAGDAARDAAAVEGMGSDAASSADSAAPSSDPNAIATFDMVVDGKPSPAATCASEPFNFQVAQGYKTIAVKNTSSIPMAFILRREWSLGTHYQPGVPTGSGGEIAGVLAPGQSVDFTSLYPAALQPAIVAILGSQERFLDPEAGAKPGVGQIPWPEGVAGSGGATSMRVIEVTLDYACGQAPTVEW